MKDILRYYVGMYIATVPNRSSPPAILLRESFRCQGEVKSRTLANLSDWDPARIEALRRALRGEFDHLAAADPTAGPVFGLLYALKQVAEELGVVAALGKNRLGKLALFGVLARLARQVTLSPRASQARRPAPDLQSHRR